MQLKKTASLVSLILSGSLLFAPSVLQAAETDNEQSDQTAQTDKQQKSDKDDNKITITGSRIKRAQMEGVTPVMVITAEEIQRRGHANVYEAIRDLTANTGGVLDEQETNSFTAAAQTVNLRGFGPGRTLVLLNGNRLPSNPKPYGGEDNFVNLALIPTTAVERVEYLSTGGSAIYGSDAIAGVINVVLKDEFEGSQINLRLTDTKLGGGDTQRLSFSHGESSEDLRWMFGAEVDKRSGLFGRDRYWLDEVTDSPATDPWLVNDRDILVAYPWGRWDAASSTWLPNWSYQDPGSAACDANPNFDYSNRPGRGNFCGHDSTGDRALRAPRDRVNAFGHIEYDLSSDSKVFADLLYWKSKADSELYYTGWWQQVSVVDDVTAANPVWLYDLYLQRTFAPEEVPNNQHFDEDVIAITTGIDGRLTSDLDYSLVLSATDYDYHEEIARFSELGGLQTFFGVDGTDPNRNRYLDSWGTYLIDPSDLQADGYTPINGANIYDYFSNGEMNGLYGLSTADGGSYSRGISFVVDGDLFELNDQTISFATVVEYNKQGYELNLDPTTDAGEYVGWSGVSGRGDRGRYALGVEFLVPITDTLETTLAARYDNYLDDSDVDGALTWQAGVSWRPNDDFLLRLSKGTTFRAPDLHRLYADANQYFGQTIDYYACMVDAGATADNATAMFQQCGESGDRVTTRQNTQGDLNLREETGETTNIGIVWSPMDELSLTLDYYKIRIEDMVTTLGASTYSQLEAECRLGFDINGNPVDSNSAYCAELYSRIQRLPGPIASTIDPINEVFLSSINMGLLEQSGLDASLHYRTNVGDAGIFGVKLNYSVVGKIRQQILKTDEVDDEVRDNSYYQSPYRHRATLSTYWEKGDWETTLYFSSVGGTRNWAGDGRTNPHTTANLYNSYRFDDNWSASFTIVNLTSARPPKEANWEAWPFYNVYAYTNGAIGREYFLNVNYQF